MLELPTTEDVSREIPLAEENIQTNTDHKVVDEEVSESPASENNITVEQQREEIIDSYSSTVANAKNRYPEQLQELRNLREEKYPQHIDSQANRQEELSGNKDNLQALEQEQQTLEESKAQEEENLEGYENNKILFFRGKKIAKSEEEIEKLSNTLNEIAEKKYTAIAAISKLERDISIRPELEPLEKRFEELVPLFQADLMTLEEKEVVFDEEFLSTLSLEEYLEIWKLGSPHYVGHVTRQGYRDHFGEEMSVGGLKNKLVGEYFDGFRSMLGDGKTHKDTLKVLYGIDLKNETFDKELVTNQIRNLDKFIKKEDVLKEWIGSYYESNYAYKIKNEEFLNQLGGEIYSQISKADFREFRKRKLGAYASEIFDPNVIRSNPAIPFILDKSAIHLSADEILDDKYGGETGNEIFVVYPTDMIASQYTFGVSDLKGDIVQKPHGSENKWNDIFVWSDDQEISIDAGIVFLPSNAMVAPTTGSRYKDDQFSRPEQLISSQEYWEKYFEENPDKKPKHLVYYNTKSSPTKAVNDFLAEQGIVKLKPQERNLGFEKNRVNRNQYDLSNDRIRRIKESADKIYESIKPIINQVNEESYNRDPVTEEDMIAAIHQFIETEFRNG
jgi:hypothetical protein